MSDNVNQIINGLNEQYGAAIEMMEKAIDHCPTELWYEPKIPTFWQVVYHTLWYLDFYLAGSKEERESFKSLFDIAPQLDKTPENKLSKEDCMQYILKIKEKAKNKFAQLKVSDLVKPSIFEWHGESTQSSLLYNLRHVMLHVGALNVKLRNTGLDWDSWSSHKKL